MENTVKKPESDEKIIMGAIGTVAFASLGSLLLTNGNLLGFGVCFAISVLALLYGIFA